ncbi:MAG: DPP IV N-terminal domain-containing protein [Acidobacteria bacterium]|nr:DPP IV N-terminal domain-containing protein [Acidobacteriota bacterium]
MILDRSRSNPALLAALLAASLLPSFAASAESPSAPGEQKKITLDSIYRKKELGIEDPMEFLPQRLAWSPMGHLLAFLQKTHAHGRVLVVVDPDRPGARDVVTAAQVREAVKGLEQAKEGVPLPSPIAYADAIAARKAVAPASGTKAAGIEAKADAKKTGEEEDEPIASFSWLRKESVIRLEVDGKRVRFDPAAGRILPDPDPVLPAGEKRNLERSRDDRFAAYTRANDLYVFDVESAREIRLTDTGTETLLNGVFPWVYWEEFMWRRTYRAFEWRPAGDMIAYLQFDESSVGTYPITDFSPVVPKTTLQRYPEVGTPNPSVRLGLVSLSSRETRWVDLGEPHEYVVFMAWTPDGSALTVQTLNRRQNRLRLYAVDPVTARGEVLIEEKSGTWVESYEPPRFLGGSGDFLWISERTGFRHLYVSSERGKKLRALTHGDWDVEAPGFGGRAVAVDEEGKGIYFVTTEPSPIERHVAWIALAGGEARRLTREPGWHSLHASADGRYWVDRWNSETVPTRIDLRGRDGAEVARLAEVTPADFAPYQFGRREPMTIRGENGAIFHASLLKPADFDPARRYPVIAHVYGEPCCQTVTRTWVPEWEMVLVNNGFLVFGFDGRGTPGRGRAWVDPTYGDQTTLPVEDWKAAVAQLKSLPYVDGDRLGVWGWSGGGTMTLNLMLRAPGLFQAGAAVAAVTDKRLYDSVYTERYLGVLPADEEAYRRSSPLEAAKDLQGKLLIAHGVSDDNVHVQNAYNLVTALTRAGKPYELYLYPQKDHRIAGDDEQHHLFSRILAFFREALAPTPGK